MFYNLEAEVKRHGMTQGELAKLMEVTPTTLSLKMNGKSEFSIPEAFKIKKLLGGSDSIDYLFARDIDEQQQNKTPTQNTA